MERLTKKHYGGNGYYMACSEHCNKECFDCKEIDKIIDRLGTYEDTGLEPQDIISAVDMAKIACALHELNAYKDIGPIDHIRDLLQAEQEGRLVVLDEKTALSMYAGARAIENNKRLFGATYVYDVFGKRGGPKEIPYFDAANNLRNIASAMSLKGGED